MEKSIISKGIVKDIIIVVIGVAIIWMGLRVVFGTENPFYVVSSGSMVPELEVYDVLVVQGNEPFDQIKVGDVIVFNRPAGQDRVIVHRVVSITDDDPHTLRTKGDANPASIPGTDFPITEEEYIGKVAHVIPQVGYVTRILTPPINYIIIGVIIAIMLIKQFAKSKKESALSYSFNMDSPNEATENDTTVDFNELDLPVDTEYNEPSRKVHKFDSVENIKKPDDVTSSKSTEKKAEE
jgi:signal peptidase I